MAKRWCWRKALGLKSSFVTKPNEISPGVIRPSYALAGMVAGAIIAKPDKVETKKFSNNDEDFFSYVFGTPHHRIGFYNVNRGTTVLKWDSTVGGKPVTVVAVYCIEDWLHLRTLFEGEEYDFDHTGDRNLIYEAFKKARSIVKEREEAKKEAEKHQKALDIIENVFSTPEPETHYEYAECDCDSGCDCCKKPAKRRVPGCEFSCCNDRVSDCEQPCDCDECLR